MTTYSTDQRFVFPVLDGDAVNTLGVSTDFPDSTIHSDTSNVVLNNNNSYIARNSVLSIPLLQSTHTQGASVAFDIRDSTIYLNANDQNNAGQLGTNIFENVCLLYTSPSPRDS